MKSPKPNFLIIGSAKCGTTALASILDSHPDCCMSRPKEVDFFQDTFYYQPNRNYERGWEWYQQAFSHYAGEPVVGEASPAYSECSRSPNTAKRIHAFNRDIKIIYLVRDPLQRQISAWKMHYALAKEKISSLRKHRQWALEGFDYWMRMQQNVKQWDECRYSYQLSAYEALFPAENICVSFLEDWQQSKDSEVERIMNFLSLAPERWPKHIQENANRGVDRTIDRPWLKKIRTHALTQSVVSQFPLSLRSWARGNIARAKVSVPEADISEVVKRDFLDHVSEDNYAFLRRYSKDLSIWKSLAQVELVSRS
ncbi:MAG: sulfotransferase [Cyanobacteria bacterium P01_A01_bin.116]